MSIIVNNWRMDPSLNALIHCETGETRRLGEYHFILLETLAKNADSVLSRSYLMSEVWKSRIVGGNSLPTAIHALRVAIDDDGKQQEIIKTIPKKGYLFNKSYLTTLSDQTLINDETEVAEESILSPACRTPEEDNEAGHEQLENHDKSLLINESPEKKEKENITLRHPYRAVFITLPVIAITLFLFIFMYYFEAPFATKPVDVPQLIKENTDNASQISVYHLYDTDTKNKTTSFFSQHLLPGMQHINPLLISHNMTMNVYYRESLSKFVLDIVLSNQCNDSWQLVLNFDNWQNKDNEMNAIMFKEVEKMLNEIPKCK
ncbi:winged helix-turn-helix domain-containing protein [Citrobacter freundii]|uniref:transcriptional regulator n=1 Tax=Citrobacter freundii TaxID=546 RepID=UPI0024DEC355|nr:winged helix-turn-helix domain-containing protein [Citrobacter freundii]MDK2361678.1 winged helix-turn-helix domain-containing protein [Citrobacter freundii]